MTAIGGFFSMTRLLASFSLFQVLLLDTLLFFKRKRLFESSSDMFGHEMNRIGGFRLLSNVPNFYLLLTEDSSKK